MLNSPSQVLKAKSCQVADYRLAPNFSN